MVDGAGTTVYTFDSVGQLLTEDGPFASDTVTNTYVNRMRIALTLQQPAGTWTNGFIYDAAARLTNVTSQAGAFTYSYLAPINHQPSTINLPNNTLNELTNAGSLGAQYYDDNGNLTN